MLSVQYLKKSRPRGPDPAITTESANSADCLFPRNRPIQLVHGDSNQTGEPGTGRAFQVDNSNQNNGIDSEWD